MTLLNRIWNRLDLRLTILILLLSVFPLVILGVVALNSSQRTLEKQQFNHLDAVTLLKADEINRWTESHVLQLNALAQRPLVGGFADTLSQVALNTTAAQSTRNNLLANHLLPTLTGEGGFWKLFLLDVDSGQILASTDEGDVGKYRNSEAYFIEGKNAAYVQNVYYKVSLGQPIMTIGTPVRNEQGVVVAVLAGHLDLAMLSRIAEQTNDLMNTEDTYLVNSFNFFVTDPRFGENYALHETVQTEGVTRCLQQESGHAVYEDYRGKVVLGAYQWLPQRELCVITEIDQMEAMGPVNTLRRSLSAVGMLVALGVVTSGLFFTRSITRPLYRLINGVERIGRGKLDYQIPVHGGDDIGRLTAAFNQMSSNLHHSVGKNLHGQKLLLTLSQAAQAVQQARTADEVYATMSAEMAKLGFDSSVLLLTEDKEHVRVAHLSYDLAVVRTAEKLTGLSASTFEFPVPPGGYFEQVVKGGKTIFISPMGNFVAEALPKRLHVLANRVAAMLGMEQGIIAPLIVDDVPLGVLTVTGDSLSEADVTAVSTFASQTAIALQNAQSIDQLQRSEARFRAIFEHAGMGIARVDMEGKPLESNPALQTILGYSAEELRGMPFTEFTYPEDAAIDMTLYQSLIAGERDVYEIEKRYVHKDGDLVWARLTVSLVRDMSGEPLFAVGMVHDITKQKQIQQAHAKQRAFLKSIYEGADLAIFVVDVTAENEFRFGGLNPAHERLTGMKSDEVQGKTPHDLVPYIPPEAADAVYANYARCLAAGKAISYEEMIPMGGQDTWWLTRLSPLKDGNGHIYRIVGTSLSITERKRAEQELERYREKLEELVAERTAELQQSEARYRTLTESSPDMIFLINPDMTVDYVNRVAAGQFGTEAAAVIGQPHAALFPPEIAARQQQALQHVLTSGEMIQAESKVKFPRGEVWLHTRLVPIALNGHGVTAVLGISRDITSLKEAELALKEKAVDLERSNKELEQFAYVASHDLQEPLRMVTNYMQLLQRRYEDQLDEKAEKYIDFAVDGASRMKVLIDDLLTFSRVGTRGKPFEPVSVALVLQQVLDDLQLSIQETNASISHDPLPTIMADDNQLRQLLQNLIGNAIKFRGETQPQVHIGVEKQDDMWHFCVQDNGIGIDPRFAERIFVIFQRLHTRTHYGGTGIGLAICKKIVERHGGQIWVESQPDSGAAFHFTIPTNNHDEENDSLVIN